MQLVVTVVVLVGFALTALGAVNVYHAARRRLARLETDRAARNRLVDENKAASRAANLIENVSEREAASEAASERWREGHAAAGIEPWDYNASTYGREFVAETFVREIAADSRRDLLLVASGIVVGLVGTLMDIWLV